MKIFILLALLFGVNGTAAHADINNDAHLVLAGIDSLTQKSSGSGSGYIIQLRSELKERYGDGGIGYIGFDERGVEFTGYNLTVSKGLKHISADIERDEIPDYPAKYSFDLKGIYAASAKGESFSVEFNQTWHVGKIYYLIQPTGGSFKIGAVKVKTAGKMKLGEYTLPKEKTTKLTVTDISGDVVIFGGLFLDHSGVAVSRVAKGATTLRSLVEMDPRFREQWIDKLDPKMFFLNSGASESHIKTSSTDYEKHLRAFIKPYVNRGVGLVIIRPGQWKDMPEILDEYGVIAEKVAKQAKVAFVSNRHLLGDDYEEAKSNGYMEEEYHPNEKGNTLIVRNIFYKVGAYIEWYLKPK